MSLGAVPAVAAFAVLLWLEHRRPLRRTVEDKARRLARNLTLAALSAAVVRLVELPLIMPLTAHVEARGWGLLALLDAPRWVRVALAVVLMDYTLYLWHVLTHRVPFLWRFHVVHHLDLDLDASTALRFHCAEIVVSLPWRAAQVAVIGVSPLAFASWQAVLMVSILFHHSNVRLGLGAERWLALLIVTPRMHGIHHSMVREEADSNWSSGLVLWDRLHGTLRLNVPQDAVAIGVPACRAPAEVGLARLLALPFVRHPPWWHLRGCERPRRPAASAPPDELLA